MLKTESAEQLMTNFIVESDHLNQTVDFNEYSDKNLQQVT
jgi:hypothetical protein